MKRGINLISAPVLAALVVLLFHQPAGGNPTDSSIRQLRKAVTEQRDGSHLRLLLSLRQLRDPSLKPLFHQLTQHPKWQVQVHAILGLAEIDPNPRVDPWLISHADPFAQEHIIINALDLDLIGLDQIKELLSWGGLNDHPQVLLLGELLNQNQEVDTNVLAELAQSSDDQVNGLASCLLLQLGKREHFERYLQDLQNLPGTYHQPRKLWLFEIARKYKLTSMLDWVEQAVIDPESDPDLVYWGLMTLIQLDPPRGMARWEQCLGPEPSKRALVRYSLLLLESCDEATQEEFDKLPADDALLRNMAGAGRALCTGENIASSFVSLLELGHTKSTLWIQETIEELPLEQATPVYVAMINAVSKDHVRDAHVALAVQATDKLFQRDPETLLNLLESAEDDSLLQQTILLGLFETRSLAVGQAAAKLRRIGSGRADSLALLLIAKHASTISDQDRHQIGTIAAGGGRVSDVLQIQAAWLYLKHSESLDHALSQVTAVGP